MATTTAQEIIDSARQITQDTAGVRWPDAEVLDWVNAGQREVVALNPLAGAKTADVTLVTGTRQTLPADGEVFLRVSRNTGSDGATPGAVPTELDAETMDRFVPSWHSVLASGTVQHFIKDTKDPKTFYVYPPQPASPYHVDLLYSALPADLTAATETIGIADVYRNALVDYLLYRCFGKDVDEASSDSRADRYYQKFAAFVGARMQYENMEATQ